MQSPVVERILALMENSNITAAALSREISLTNGLLTQWKQGKQSPSLEAVSKIANYFKVSIDYLVTGTTPLLNETEQSVLNAYKKANPAIQQAVNKLLDL